jgi:hypothetical protein
MAVNIPAAINLMTSDPDSVKRSNIGSPVSVSKKSAGNLPITEDASQYISNQQGDTAGILWDMASVDASANTKLLVLSWQFNAPNRIQCDTMSNSGIIMRIGSGSGNNNYKEYKVGGNDTPTASSQA